MDGYYFDGEGGCDLCQSASGFKVGSSPPALPHDGCNCPIDKVVVKAQSGCKQVLRMHSLTDGTDDFDSPWSYDNCDSDEDMTRTGMLTHTNDDASFDEGVRDFAEDNGLMEPDLENDTADHTLPRRSKGKVTSGTCHENVS